MPTWFFVVIMLFCCFQAFALVLIAVFGEWLFEVLTWWTLALANFLAGLVRLELFLRRHRSTWCDFLVLSQ